MGLFTPIRRGRIALCMLLSLLLTTQLHAQLVLNEMMASNASTLEDQFYEFPDWLEIYNSGANTIELSNYWLSDDVDQLKKWKFPPMRLPGGSYLVVFASGKNVVNSLAYWHTIVNTGEKWKYFIPTEEIGDDWKSSTTATEGWSEGKSGLGYNDNDDSTVISQTISFYMQKEFELGNVDEISDAALFMDYDDGFVAYLNGTEIARSSNMGDSGRVVNYNAPAGGNREAAMYNGSPPEAYYFSERTDLLKEGTNVLAIQVHNVSSTSSDMSAIPFLLLGFSSFQEDLVYRNPYFVVKDKYPHTNFKIQSAGEAIFLSNDDGAIVDQISNIHLPTDFSYGRTSQNANQFGYFENPTPGNVNDSEFSLDYFTDSVKIISHGDDFELNHRFHMESKIADDQIHFTTDGSEPDQNSPLFSAFMDLSQTTVVKARVYRSNSLPGPVTTRTLFVGNKHELPVISVSMNPDDLWDYNTGIYVMGPNAGTNSPYHGANFWQDWEKPAHIEIFNEEGDLLLSQGAGTKIFGGYSRAHPQRSMSFFARRNYGDGSFSYPLFKEKPDITSFESFVLRNDGNDWCNGMFRDAITAYMSAQMGVDHQAHQPYVMYLNGEYWGIINMREKVNEHFIASNHHVYAEDVNILTGNRNLVTGNAESYNKMYDFITNNNLSGWQEYAEAKRMIHVQNYIRYWALNVYVDNKDWPGNNIKYWSTNAPGSLYRWISYDTDFGYSIWDHTAYTINTLKFSFSEWPELTWANQEWATDMITSLIDNDSFRRQFVNEFADRMNTTFHPDTMIPVVDSFEQKILNEAPAHFDRWIGDPNNWLSYPNWLSSVERIRTYFRERPQYMRQFLMERFNIPGISDITVHVSDSRAGYVKLNSIDLKSYPFTGTYFVNVPIRLEAIPAPGYVFSHWSGDFSTDTTTFFYPMSGPGEFIAVFEAVDSASNIVINEINYSSQMNKNIEDWVELYNNSGVSVDLSGWTLSNGFSGDSYEIPEGTWMPANSYLVLSRNQPDFKRFFPELNPVLGNFVYGIDSQGDGLALKDPDGILHDYVIFENTSPWPVDVNGSGLTLELINPKLDNALGKSWKASLDITGTPCALNSQYGEVVIGVEKDKVNLFSVQAYPSPFTSHTTITFRTGVEQNISISVYSSSGKLIELLANTEFDAGDHKIVWTPKSQISAGLYFVNIRSELHNQTLKVIYQ